MTDLNDKSKLNVNVYFPDEYIEENDLYFICSMIERVSRVIKQPNKYVVNALGYDELMKLLSVANVLHSENPLAVVADWIKEYNLMTGTYDVTNVNHDLCGTVPTELQMGKVYMRLILQTAQPGEDYAQGIIRVYNDEICKTIDNYNCSAYYEPSPYIARSYFNGGF